MSSTITTEIRGGAALNARLDQAGNRAMGAVEKAIKTCALELVAYIKSKKLSDQVLKVRTGTLRRSITAQFESSGNSFTARVGTNLVYARIHEFGFKGTVNVKEHQRLQTMAWGKLMKNPKSVSVRSHAVNMNTPKRPYLGPSLEENKERYITNIRRALTEVLAP